MIYFSSKNYKLPPPPPPFHHSLIVSNVPTSFGRGAALCIHPKLSPFASPISTPDTSGTLAAATLSFPGFPPILLCSMYIPYTSPERDLVVSLLTPLLSQYPLHLLGGDFNTCLSPLDSIGVLNTHPWPWLQNMVSGTLPSLIDSFRLYSPNTQGYTRPPSTLHPYSQSRLDYFFLSSLLHSTFPLLSASILYSDTTSDHFPISVCLKAPFYPTPTSSPPPSPPAQTQQSSSTGLSVLHGSPAPYPTPLPPK